MVSERKFIEQICDNYVKLRLAIALAYHCSFVDFTSIVLICMLLWINASAK